MRRQPLQRGFGEAAIGRDLAADDRKQWGGAGWKASDGSELTGTSSRPGGASRWTVRRWQASELTEKGHRLFKINGKKILIRGAAWAPDMFLRPMSKKLDADLAYVRDMGMNTIRLEGRIDRDEFFEKTDKLGILVMP